MVEKEQRLSRNGLCLPEQRDLVTLSPVPHVAAVWVNPFILKYLELKNLSAAANLLLWQ